MPARLIVNADDFGLTPGVNQAITELHTAGVVTSATLMARGDAFAHAVELAHAHPTLGVGCHIVLTDGQPVSSPETISSLLARDGRSFRPVLRDFVVAVLRGRVKREDIRREAVAQIQTLQRAGIRVTHLDTHKHTHVLPQVAGPLLEAAEITGIPAIRNPFEANWSLRFGYSKPFRLLAVVLTRLLRRSFLARKALRSGHIVTTNGTIGISATGRLDEPVLRKILNALAARDGTWELVCHPGYNDRDLQFIRTRLLETREVERKALLNAFTQKDSSHPQLPELIHYGRLAEAAMSSASAGVNDGHHQQKK
ncbi:MAG: ChbG/HpnK family deacetylase [Janthinobacterium lividum]